MHDHLDDLRSTVRSLVAPHLATDSEPTATLDTALWNKLAGLGLTGLALPDELGGSDGDLLDASTVLGELTTTRVPYAEAAIMAAPALAAAGIAIPSEPLTAGTAEGVLRNGLLDATAHRIPFARDCAWMVLLLSGTTHSIHLVCLQAAGVTRSPGSNLAGEPRDTVVLAGVRPMASASLDEPASSAWTLRAALARAVASAGVAAAIVEATARHVKVREQFGRPLVKFQAVQHSLATMAAQAATMEVAAHSATLALLHDPDSAELLVAAAKAETAALSRPLTAAAHQAHGAIGFTREHGLGALTMRLLSWRDEHRNEQYWHGRIGRLSSGRDLWDLVAMSRGDQHDGHE